MYICILKADMAVLEPSFPLDKHRSYLAEQLLRNKTSNLEVIISLHTSLQYSTIKQMSSSHGPLGHTNYILRMTDPDRPFYVMSEGKKNKNKICLSSFCRRKEKKFRVS